MDEAVDQRLKENEQVPGNDDSLEWHKNRLGQLAIIHISMFYAK